MPPEPVQGLSGSPGSGLKKPPRSLGRRGKESQGAEMPHPTPNCPEEPDQCPTPTEEGHQQGGGEEQADVLLQQHPGV